MSQAVEEILTCGKFETVLTEKECRCCYEAASYYLNDNVRGGSKIFAPPKLEKFSDK